MKELLNNEIIKVGLALALGLALIIILNPPHTACQSQKELIDEALVPLKKRFARDREFCITHSEPGGCISAFESADKLLRKIKETDSACIPDLSEDEDYKKMFTNMMGMYVRVAWGSKPPASYVNRNGWLELAHVQNFCRLKKELLNIYGEDAWSAFVEAMLADLPGAADLGRNEAWTRTILSDQCRFNF